MTMVQVHFLPEDLLVQAPAGTPLQAIADAAGADITFGCRSGSCGTCRVRVRSGQCSAMGSEERAYLAGIRAPEDHRLACQVTVEANLELEYLGIEP
jgi:ferredoxin